MNWTRDLAPEKISTDRFRGHRADGADTGRGGERIDRLNSDFDASDRSEELPSVIFPEEFDEIDELYPYDNEGGEVTSDPSFFLCDNLRSRETTIQSRISVGKVDVPPVDWSSLLKSCKLAKLGFRDPYSEQTVVKNMFLTHLLPLTAVLNLYSKKYCDTTFPSGGLQSFDEVKACITETKRALRFAISCVAPTRVECDRAGWESAPISFQNQDSEEGQSTTRSYRQDLQEVAVRGFSIDEGSDPQGETSHHLKLHFLLAKIIHADMPCHSSLREMSLTSSGSSEYTDLFFSAEEGHRNVRVHAARLLCNIVTDNPLAAGIVLRDIPLSPTPDVVEMRMAGSIMGSQDYLDDDTADDKEMIFWSDLINATAKIQGEGKIRSGHCEDREALAAVAAALHNLLTSLEVGPSISELKNNINRDSVTLNEDEVERRSVISDTGFEMSSDGILLNSLLRNILPAKAVLLQSQFEEERTKPTGPRFIPPPSADENISDSATEWISLVLERLASRGFLLNMLHSIGGAKSKSVTPEQVVLVSCIRQAIDNYHSALIRAVDTKKFGRRSSFGTKISLCAHPLWGRADAGGGGKSVPVLLSLANEIEGFRRQLTSLRQGHAVAMYDGEENCTIHIIDDLCDILAQTLGDHISRSPDGAGKLFKEGCFITDARSVIGRETSLISNCCLELGRILDISLTRNAGQRSREMQLSPQEQQTAIIMVRLIANVIYQCRYNQDLLRKTPIPIIEAGTGNIKSVSSTAAQPTMSGTQVERTGLHVLLSTTALAPACFTLREWCIVAIRNSVEGNAANTEMIRSLEANQALNDTPELRRMGVKIDIDANGKVLMTRGSQSSYPSDSDQVSWA